MRKHIYICIHTHTYIYILIRKTVLKKSDMTSKSSPSTASTLDFRTAPGSELPGATVGVEDVRIRHIQRQFSVTGTCLVVFLLGE